MAKYLTFFVWPFASFIHAFVNGFRKKEDRVILFLLSGFLGLTFTVDTEGSDVFAYLKVYESYAFQDFSFLVEMLNSYFITFTSPHSDIGIHILSFLLSRISTSPELYFILMGLMFGYFYAQIFAYIGRLFDRKNFLSFTFLAMLILAIFPTQGINQRFWIATMIFIYGVQQNILQNKKIGILTMLLSAIMHSGMAVPIIGVLLFKFTKKVPIGFTLLLIPIGAYLSTNLLSLLEPVALMLGGVFEKKIINYTGEFGLAFLEERKSSAWYSYYWRQVVIIALSLPLSNLLFNFKKLKKEHQNLLKLNVFLLSTAALLSEFSMNFRFFEIVIFLQTLTLYIYTQQYHMTAAFKWLLFLSSPGILFLFFMKISSVLQFIKPTFFIANYMTAWFFGDMYSTWYYIDPIN